MKNLKKILIAGVIGDAFGYMVEFDDILSIKQKFGPKGLTFDKFGGWCCSDDTQMTLFLLDAINKINIFDISKFQDICHAGFYDWYKTQVKNNTPSNYKDLTRPSYYSRRKENSLNSLLNKTKPLKLSDDLNAHDFTLLSYKPLWMRCAPGKTCLSALGSGYNGSIDLPINDSMGCGAVMRVAPFLKLVEKFKISDLELLNAAYIQAATTHGNKEGLLATGFYTLLLKYLSDGYSKEEAFNKANSFVHNPENDSFGILNEVKNVFREYLRHIEYLIKIEKIIPPNEIAKKDKCGGGWISSSCVGMAYYAFAKSNSFEHCLEIAVNHEGDSDSIGTLAAQLYVAGKDIDMLIYKKTDLTDVICKLSDL